MRVTKDAAVRRTELLDAAAMLFMEKGYATATVQDVIEAVGIAKGTFYHHFPSKQALMEALVDRETERRVALARAYAAEDAEVGVRLAKVLGPMGGDARFNDYLHTEPALHQRSLVGMVDGFTPIVAGLVAEGIGQGLFAHDDPEAATRLLLTGIWTVLDGGLFPHLPDQEQARVAIAAAGVLEVTFAAPEGYFLALFASQLPEPEF